MIPYIQRLAIALFLHSMFIVSLQVVLMRVLSIMQWDNFAHLMISIAMLGFGIGGTVLSLFRKRWIDKATDVIPWIMLLTSATILLTFWLSQRTWLMFDTYLIFTKLVELAKVGGFILLFLVPFLLGSIALGLTLISQINHIGTMYFFNLLGSGAGGVCAMGLLHWLDPNSAIVLISFFPLCASLFVLPHNKKSFFLFFQALVLSLIIFFLLKPVDIKVSEYKALSKTMLLPDARKAMEYNGLTSQITIVESEYLRYVPLMSLQHLQLPPAEPFVFRNGHFTGTIANEKSLSLLDNSLFSLPFELFDFQSVIFINSGTGNLVQYAVNKDVSRVVAVEPDFVLTNALRLYAFHSGRKTVLENPAVEYFSTSARFILGQTSEVFDLIVLPTLGYFGHSTGMTSLREEFDVTFEAFKLYWERLSDKGVIFTSAYLDQPPRVPVKILFTLVEMLRLQNIDKPLKHILAVRSWNAIGFLVKKDGFSAGDREKVLQWCDNLGFDIFISPYGIKSDSTVNQMADKTLFNLSQSILEGNMLLRTPFRIAPATDDRPYFSNFVRLGGVPGLREIFSGEQLFFVEPGYFIILVTLLFLLVFSLLIIFIPVVSKVRNNGKGVINLYFFCIGLGFMFVELVFIQQFVFFLGNPIYSTSVTLVTMLVFSGIGSYFSENFVRNIRHAVVVFLTIGLLLLLNALMLNEYLRATMSVPMWLKWLVVIGCIAPPSFLMGIPFPFGMKRLTQVYSRQDAWAWAVNGFASVLAVPLAQLILVEIGARWVLAVAALVYLIPIFSLYLYKKHLYEVN